MKEQTKNFVTTPRSQIKCENSFPCLHIALFCSFSTSIEVFTLERERKEICINRFSPKKMRLQNIISFQIPPRFLQTGLITRNMQGQDEGQRM